MQTSALDVLGIPASMPARRLGARRALLLSCTALCVPLATQVHAQEAGDAAPITLAPITVTDTSDDAATSVVVADTTSSTKTETAILDTPSSVSVVTQKEIEQRGAETLEQVIAYTAGVSVNEWGADDRYDSFRLRGFDQTSLGQIYWNGLPQRGMGWTFSRREPYGLERVDIVKGANSSLFGLSSPGGLVNLISKTPQNYRFGEIYTTVGQDHFEFGTDFGDVLNEDGTLYYRVTAKYQDGAYSYDYSNDDRVYVQAGLTWAPTDATELTVLAEYYDHDSVPGNGIPSGYGIDPDTFLGAPEYNKMNSVEKSIGYQFSHDFGNGLTFRSNARYSHFDLDYEQAYGATGDPSVGLTLFAVYGTSEQVAIDNQLQYDTSIGGADSRTLLGVEYTWIQVDEDDYYSYAAIDGIDIFNPSYCTGCTYDPAPYHDWTPEQNTTAIYLQEELTYGNWVFVAGGRYDWLDIKVADAVTGQSGAESYQHFSKRLGATYKINPNMSVYASYSESFMQDLWGLAAGDDPTEGTQYEMGFKYQPAGMNALFTAAIFDLTQTNVSSQVSPTEFQQIGKIGVRGLELEGKAQINENFDVIASYSYWDARILEDGIAGNDGNRPARTPEHLASLWLDYTIPGNGRFGDLSLGAGVRFVGDTYGDDANTTLNAAYTLVDAALAYEVADNVDLAVNVSNLFDKEYVTTTYYGTDYYGDGRKVTATLKYSW